MAIAERQENINLFDGDENLSILHLSDIHLWYSTNILKKLASLITAHNPDLLILTGDYYDLPKGAYNFRKFLSCIAKKYTVVFIKGNHDTIYGTTISNLLLEIPNCFLVENFLYKYQSPKGHLYNITSWKNRHQLPSNQHEKNIVLIHNPEKIKTNELNHIHLILAGHLHGGQFIFLKQKIIPISLLAFYTNIVQIESKY